MHDDVCPCRDPQPQPCCPGDAAPDEEPAPEERPAPEEKPTDDEDDFKLAEVVFDRERMLILSYRSFGWPEDPAADVPDGELPLLESYAYENIKTNVGLTDRDFDVKNDGYSFP